MAQYEVYYAKPEYFSLAILGRELPKIEDFGKTHTFLRIVEATDLDDVYYKSQGEIWSPNGEARELIESKGLSHTSMSIGDVIKDPEGKYYVVAIRGFGMIK